MYLSRYQGAAYVLPGNFYRSEKLPETENVSLKM